MALAEIMHRSNIIALVYEDERNNVVIWDNHEKKIRTEITFSADYRILNIKLRKDYLVIVFESKTFIFSFEIFKLIEKVQTSKNANGLCALSQAEKPINKVICLPAETTGSIRVIGYGKYLLKTFPIKSDFI